MGFASQTILMSGLVIGVLVACGTENQSLRGSGTALDGRRFGDPEFSCGQSAALSLLDAANPNYNDDIKPLLTMRCTGCHSTGGGISPNLSTYALAKAMGAASIAEIEAGSMPTAGALPAGEQALFRKWVDAGMPEAAPPPAGDDGAADDAGADDGVPADGGASDDAGTTDAAAGDDAGGNDGVGADGTGDDSGDGAGDGAGDGSSADATPAQRCPAPTGGTP